MDGPCEAIVTADDIDSVCDVDQFDEDNPPSDALLQSIATAASRIAWTLAGRRHGLCSVVGERPGRFNRTPCVTRTGGIVCTCCWTTSTGCRCQPAPTVLVGNGFVRSIDDVRIGGVSLATDAYRLVKGRRLVRTDGKKWPACQLPQHDDDHEDVLVVDYTWGVPVDEQMRRATAKFGCEMLKGSLGRECELPSGVTSVTRQGINFDILDPFEFLQEGRTGVYEFDLWLSTANPNRLRRGPRVTSPDISEPFGAQRASP